MVGATAFYICKRLAASNLNGAPVAIRSAKDAIAHGIYLAPEDRKRSGLVLEDSVADNISLPDLLSFARYFLMNSAAERKNAERQRIQDVADLIDADAALPPLFAELPRLPYGIRPMEPYEGDNAEHYTRGAIDGSRAGFFEANTNNLQRRAKCSLTAHNREWR